MPLGGKTPPISSNTTDYTMTASQHSSFQDSQMEIAPGEGKKGDRWEDFFLRAIHGGDKPSNVCASPSVQEPRIHLVLTPVSATCLSVRGPGLRETVVKAQRTIWQIHSMLHRKDGKEPQRTVKSTACKCELRSISPCWKHRASQRAILPLNNISLEYTKGD